jgi:2-polyprenyl-6-methoxyphenol hydroxylase-like FAD-dependent oxidoreductase
MPIICDKGLFIYRFIRRKFRRCRGLFQNKWKRSLCYPSFIVSIALFYLFKPQGMPLSSEPAVLIVGAGPTGLMLACQLALRRIPFRIIDRKAGPTDRSKALAVQARSLEIFEQMGLQPVDLGLGQAALGLNFLVEGRWVQHISLQGIGQGLSPYPFLYILEQSKTERLLLDFLAQYHLEVEWNTELIHVEQSPDQVRALLRYKDLTEEEVEMDWLVGADGAGSLVRQASGIPFVGGTYPHTFLVADTGVEWDFNHQEVFLCLGQDKLAAFFPMPGTDRFRVVSLLPRHLENQADLDFSQVAPDLEKSLGFPLRFRDTAWFSTYRLQHRYARQFRQGRLFLAGDAAHLHSPVGGQGMNTGLQDAYNLAWKLALVVQKAADADLLHTYQQERLPVAKKLVNSTDRAFSFLVSPSPVWQLSRRHLLPLLLKKVFRYNQVRSLVFRRVSQIGIRYPKSPVSVSARGSNHFPGHAPQPGDRVPYTLVFSPDHDKMLSLYDLLRNPYFTLLVFKSTFSTDRAEQLQEELADTLAPPIPELLTTTIIYPHEKNNGVYEMFGINEDAFYLVRPDNYIAFRSQPANLASLLEYLQETLQIPRLDPDTHDLEDLFDPAFD